MPINTIWSILRLQRTHLTAYILYVYYARITRPSFKIADVSVSSWNGSTVPAEQLHTNCRRCWSSASAVRQSAEVDRSALSPEQYRSTVFCCRGLVYLEFAIPDSLRDPALSLDMFRRQLKTYFSAKY